MTRPAQFGPGAVGVGWDMALMALAMHLQSGEVVDPQEAARWTASAEGRRFVSSSSGRWREANVAAGTGSEAAREAAERTATAYTAGS